MTQEIQEKYLKYTSSVLTGLPLVCFTQMLHFGPIIDEKNGDSPKAIFFDPTTANTKIQKFKNVMLTCGVFNTLFIQWTHPVGTSKKSSYETLILEN
jgi:hypothetical protein